MTSTYSPHCHGIHPQPEIKDVFGLLTKKWFYSFCAKQLKK